MAKLSELWQEVEQAQAEHTAAGARMSIIEAHKVLKVALDTKGYPGKTVERKLFWAGYSGQDKEGISEALNKYQEVTEKFDYLLSDFEAQEITKIYHEVIQKIMKEPNFGFVDQLRAFFKTYFSPKSIQFWKYLAILLGTFTAIKILSYTEVGKEILGLIVGLADFVISWIFVAIILVFSAGFVGIKYYFDNRSKVKIRD